MHDFDPDSISHAADLISQADALNCAHVAIREPQGPWHKAGAVASTDQQAQTATAWPSTYLHALCTRTCLSRLRKASKVANAAKAQAGRLEAAGLTASRSFQYVARDWLATVHRNKVSAGHADRTLVRFAKDIFPFIGRRPVNAIHVPELLACLRRIEARGAIEMTHCRKDAAGQVFRYGIAAGECTRNSAADLRDALRPVESGHHAAVVDPKQAGALLRDMLACQGHPVTRAALAL